MRKVIAAINKTQLNLIDEYQLCIHPMVAGGGLPLFKNISRQITFRLLQAKRFTGGAVILYYEPQRWLQSRKSSRNEKKVLF